MPRELTAFFERYRDSFNALDGAAIADLYAEPSGIAQSGSYTHWPTRAPIRENMDALCRVYRDKGYSHADFEVTSFILQGNQYAVADLRWRVDWSRSQAAWTFRTTYNLLRTELGWKVLLCTAYEESHLHGALGAA